MTLYALPCLVCRKPLEEVDPARANNQPMGGVGCSTSGNYGSRVYDPMNGERAEFNLCDECFEQARRARLIGFFDPNRQLS